MRLSTKAGNRRYCTLEIALKTPLYSETMSGKTTQMLSQFIQILYNSTCIWKPPVPSKRLWVAMCGLKICIDVWSNSATMIFWVLKPASLHSGYRHYFVWQGYHINTLWIPHYFQWANRLLHCNKLTLIYF